MMGDYSTAFGQAVLNDLGDPQTSQNLLFLQAWSQAEGGTASYNPFNTTQRMPGSSSYNNVGVQNYTSFDQGVAATVKTLTNGRYADILRGLSSGTSAISTAESPSLAVWGTGTGVLRVLGSNAGLSQSEADPSANGPDGTVSCYWKLSLPVVGSICLDPILWLALGMVGTGVFLLGVALVAIGSGHGAGQARKFVESVGAGMVLL